MKFRDYKHWLIISLIFIIIHFLFFPKFYTSIDEKEYIQTAYQIATKIPLVNTSVECSGYGNGAYGFFNGVGCVSKYNIGTSLILLPFVAIHWQLAFLATLLAVLISGFIFSKLLKINKLDAKYIYLFLLYPPISYYSLKSMSEIFSMTLLLLLYYTLLKLETSKNKFVIFSLSLVSSFAVLVKYNNAIIVLIFFSYFFFKFFNKSRSESIKSFLLLIFFSFPFASFFFFINYKLYGGILKSGYALSGEELFFSFDVLKFQLPHYLAILIFLYPLMFMGFWQKKLLHFFPASLSILVYLFFYLPFPGFSFGTGVLNLIFGFRFLLPVWGFLALGYSSFLDKLFKLFSTFFPKNISKFIFLSTITILVFTKIIISYTLKQKTDTSRVESDLVYSSSVINEKVDAVPLLVNLAFKKGFRFLKNVEPWVRLENRKEIYVNVSR